jgi:hypothetical protein
MLEKLHSKKRLQLTGQKTDDSIKAQQLVVRRIDGIMHLEGAMRLLHIVNSD